MPSRRLYSPTLPVTSIRCKNSRTNSPSMRSISCRYRSNSVILSRSFFSSGGGRALPGAGVGARPYISNWPQRFAAPPLRHRARRPQSPAPSARRQGSRRTHRAHCSALRGPHSFLPATGVNSVFGKVLPPAKRLDAASTAARSRSREPSRPKSLKPHTPPRPPPPRPPAPPGARCRGVPYPRGAPAFCGVPFILLGGSKFRLRQGFAPAKRLDAASTAARSARASRHGPKSPKPHTPPRPPPPRSRARPGVRCRGRDGP